MLLCKSAHFGNHETLRGRYGEHQISIERTTTDDTIRSSVDSSGAHDRGNLHQRRMIRWLRRLVEEFHDRGAIEPRSRCDRATIVTHLERSWHMITPRLMAHDHRAIMAINPTSRPNQTAPKFGQKSPLKGQCIPLSFLTFD